MPVQFVRKPVDGGLPFININGHGMQEFARLMRSFARDLNANGIGAHPKQLALMAEAIPDNLVKALFWRIDLPKTEALFLRDGEPVGRVIGLPEPPEPSDENVQS